MLTLSIIVLQKYERQTAVDGNTSLLSFRPGMHALKNAIGYVPLDVESVAAERWTIAPAMKRFIVPAAFLPGQLERIRGTEFGSIADVCRDFQGSFEAHQGETLGYRLKDVDLVDGVLYASGAIKHLRPRLRRRFAYSRPDEVSTGSLYESWAGNRWFGNWLADDCLAYQLAEQSGAPVTTALVSHGHAARYEELLGVLPDRLDRARFRELIVFDDRSNNAHKKARADLLRTRLLSAAPSASHAGVFLLRGNTGMRRVLTNERAIAERLAEHRGFRVLDPMISTVEEIVNACGGARIIMGVEGSHLVHGLMVMPPEAVLFVIQPPDRVVSVLKLFTDRQEQAYAFVVGQGTDEEFSAEWTEIDRTLDLALNRTH